MVATLDPDEMASVPQLARLREHAEAALGWHLAV